MGGMPINTHKRFSAARRSACKSGICTSVWASVLRAWFKSKSLVCPSRKRRRAISKTRALEHDVRPHQLDPLLVGADLHVVLGHVAQEGDHGAVVPGAIGLQRVLRSHHREAESTPEIHLPGHIQSRVQAFGGYRRSRQQRT